ncbi:hypothetical protein [Algoriphagus sp. CAU 1675]|uniref:hypothetical protein n=1 Tax=Algoriphagus sp. CAU 1675 TaxID=3032597 RepID=UPI0023DAB4C2|nr:hypothetical protein [Algoriphagus sp. CAU 1675]MDF2157193.1 hypothetical protein [Algoriphagus sp. CAU 1675]
MPVKISPVFQVFEQQYQDAKQLYLDLGKQIKSKKAIELQGKLSFLDLYVSLIAKIHFEKEGLEFQFLSPFKQLTKNLKKINHLKLVERGLKRREGRSGETFNSFSVYLDRQKKDLYNETFDLVVGSPLKTWEDFHVKSLEFSKGIKPLMINTAINQLIQEELEFFHFDQRSGLDSKAKRDTFEGLRRIIMLENLLINLGFNPIFVESVHSEIETLKENLKPWYANHLELQSLTYFLGQKEEVSNKYLQWVIDLKEEKKSLSSKVEKQALALFKKILV